MTTRPLRASCSLTSDEHARVSAAAAAEDRTVSAWLRRVVLAELGDRTVDELLEGVSR